MPFGDRDLDYLENVHPALDAVATEMLAAGRAESIPIVQLPVARFLHVVVAAVRPARVVEIGTAIGFSTLWMATALPPNGRIDTIDPDRSRTDRARRYWIRAQVGDRIRVVNEPALRVLPRLAPGIDLAFIDAVKTEYSAYLEALLPKMRPGAVILADNLLSLHLRYFDGQRWSESWDSSSLPPGRQLPVAVAIQIQMAAPGGRPMDFATQVTVPMAIAQW